MSETPTTWPSDVRTLSIDIGGTGLKGAILDASGSMVTERIDVTSTGIGTIALTE